MERRLTVSHSRDFASFPASFILSLCQMLWVMMNVSGRNLNINKK